MAGFVACTLGIQEIIRLGSGTDANQTAVRFSSFFRLLFFLERKEEYGKAMIKIAGCMRDFREKKIPGIRDQIPLPDPDTYLREDKAKQTRFAFFRRGKTSAKRARSSRYVRQE